MRGPSVVPGCGLDVMTGDGPRVDCGMEARFVGEQAVLAVRGEVDSANALKLGALFDAVIASGYFSVVLELAELNFMDSAGLG